MRAAPPVQAALNGGRLERMLIIVLHAVAGATLATWLAAHAEFGPVWQLLGGVLLAAGLMAMVGAWLARRVLTPLPGQLRWDGQIWGLVNPAAALPAAVVPLARLVVALDLGVWVLLRLHLAAGGPVLWRTASARGAPSSWHGLRVALAAHAGAAGVPADQAAP